MLLERALLLKKMCAVYHVPLLINDRLDIALAVQADGVHVGQMRFAGYCSAQAVRSSRQLLAHRLITLEEARQAPCGWCMTIWAAVRCFGTTTQKIDAGLFRS